MSGEAWEAVGLLFGIAVMVGVIALIMWLFEWTSSKLSDVAKRRISTAVIWSSCAVFLSFVALLILHDGVSEKETLWIGGFFLVFGAIWLFSKRGFWIVALFLSGLASGLYALAFAVHFQILAALGALVLAIILIGMAGGIAKS